MSYIPIIAGQPIDRPIATYLWGGNSPAIYAVNDVLSAAVYSAKALTALFVPEVGWYTKAGTQTGYGQGQVVVSIDADDSALLMPSGSYWLLVWVTPASAPTKTYPIVRIPLKVESLS